jgi:ferrous iron transport protein A
MFLSDLRRGDKFRIVKVCIGGAIGKRLVDMGLNRGVEGVMVRCAMLGDPVQIHLRDYNLSLRLAEAAGVEIDLVEQGCRHPHPRGRAHHGGRLGPGLRSPFIGRGGGPRSGPGRGKRRGRGPLGGRGRDTAE